MAFGFGNTQTATTGGGLFGGGSNTQTTTGGGLFGQNTQQQPAQQSSGLFGQPAQQQQQPQSTGLFGQPAQQQQQQQQQPQNTGLFGQPAQQQQGGGLFGQQQPPQQQTSAFGQTQQQPQQSLFGQPQQQQQQQPQQQPSMFGQTLQQPQQQQNQLGQTQWQSQPQPGQAQPVPEQMKSILEQWMPQSSTCKFRTYFYNKVSDHLAPFAQPGPQDDLKAWDEALSKKPAHGYIPVLCVGFEQLGQRIQAQQRELAVCNTAMHQINGSLEANMTKHDTSTSVRILEAKRKHVALTQRTLALATKVQIMRNRGYAMDPAEEALKAKLESLEKNVCDPQILARSEEIWARMVQVQARSQWLEKEMAKQAGAIASGLSEEDARRAEKVLEDYATNLTHLKKELVAIAKEFEEWQKEQGADARRR